MPPRQPRHDDAAARADGARRVPSQHQIDTATQIDTGDGGPVPAGRSRPQPPDTAAPGLGIGTGSQRPSADAAAGADVRAPEGDLAVGARPGSAGQLRPAADHHPAGTCVGCGARLAGGRAGQVCWPCHRRAEMLGVPPPVDPWIWSAAGIRSAARRRHFGELVRAYRFAASDGKVPVSQERVASWFGLTQPQLSRIETGPAVNDLSRLVRWARTLGVPAELLWFRADDPDETPSQRPPSASDLAPATPGATGPTLGRLAPAAPIATPAATPPASAGGATLPASGRAMSGPVTRSSPASLRVGIIAPPWLPVPPPMYGGTELVIDTLARGLAQRGHEVELFATGDSTCPVKRGWVYDRSIPSGIGTTAIELNHAAAAYQALAGCDIIHDTTLAGLFIGQLHPHQPIVTTNHGPFAPVLADVYRRTASVVPLVAISADQAARAPADIPVAAVVHHGLDLSRYRFNPIPGDYYACLGRMHPDKGIDRAIEIARLARVPLKIAAKMREPAEQRYLADVIEPLLGEGITYIGEADHPTKVDLLAGAKALLNLIRWPEPFGLVTIEALACGTPVIATPCGAVPELIEHDTTGYLAATTPDLVAAIRAVDRLDRPTCRRHAEQRFSMARLADHHEAVYRRVIRQWRRSTR